MNTKDLQVLQTFVSPTDQMKPDRDLFAKQDGDVTFTSDGRINFGPQSRVDFGTWFNLFSLATWQSRCKLGSLFIIIEGDGHCQLTVRGETREGPLETQKRSLSLMSGEPQFIDLRDFLSNSNAASPPEDAGVLSCEVQSTSKSATLSVRRIAWATADAPKRRPDLTLAVTTFKREAAVRKAAQRFHDYCDGSPLQAHLRMIIVDNGGTLSLDDALSDIEIIENPNLGGAGGFSRGMLEARDRGASHVLFMDDDASIYMEALERTWSFLAYAQDETTAISGAMATERHPWALWEYGALFFKNCVPLLGGADLRDWRVVLDVERHVADPMPEHLYGGWWYFAFPVKAAEYLAFPFFVRGDDVSFSLANDFNIVRLNGVVSYQDSFIEKESPQTWYLDLRSHLVHHLSIGKLKIGRWSLAAIAAKFFLKNLAKMHYETTSAVNLAVEDVLNGPGFFVDQVDMAKRRAELKSLTVTEEWHSRAPEQGMPICQTEPKSRAYRLLMKLCLNGHLVPGFRYLGLKQAVSGDFRGWLGVYWGVSEMTVLSADGDKVYKVTHSKLRAFKEGLRMVRNLTRLIWGYSALLDDYQTAYIHMTSEAFWRDQFDQHGTTQQGTDVTGKT